jgi:hypothetical protein
MLAQDVIAELHHLHASDAQTTTLETVNYFSNKLTLNTTWFQQY